MAHNASHRRRFMDCLDKHSNFPYDPESLYCNATYDGFLCWPPTRAGTQARQNCPPARFSDATRLAFRRCGESGVWLGKRLNEVSATGWTNYTPCFPAEVQILFDKVNDDDESDAQLKFDIAQRTRNMEIAGFSISLIALIISLVILVYFKSLRNTRTRIHTSLFAAMVMQVVTRLTLYIDQAFNRRNNDDTTSNDHVKGIDNIPYLCESSYVILEYAITAMFMWMFIEGMYMHRVVTANALRENISQVTFNAFGWGLPIFFTSTWATITSFHYKKDMIKQCWYGYNFSPLYWILQGPRLAAILLNMMFLLNIMRVLIVKLQQSESTEVEKVRKAVRAALVLLPLLGITNVLNMTEAPLDGNVWLFALWSYGTHFLRSFQGFFIALIYCFLNEEVGQVLKRHYDIYKARRTMDNPRQRDSFRFISSSGDNRQQPTQDNQDDDRQTSIQMNAMTGTTEPRPSSNENSGTECHKDSMDDDYQGCIKLYTVKWLAEPMPCNNENINTEMRPECSQNISCGTSDTGGGGNFDIGDSSI